MPKKLAITIAGAVSLGSYEAGVLWEVLDAIRQHNADASTPADEKIIVDVLTGASAGGMTAIILAQKLLYSGPEFVGPYDNPLYNTWVKRISLEGLQNTGDDEGALLSIFSSNLIETISHEALTARYEQGPAPEQQPHAAVDGELRVGVAMTNLNGLLYQYKVEPSGAFGYIDYRDQLTRHVTKDSDNARFWESLRQAAVACGAFPFAFRAQEIVRSKVADHDDYDSPNLDFPQPNQRFTYSDGGILQNQPLGMAKNLVDRFDNHLGQEQRFYLFVSPHPKNPAPSGLSAEDANYLTMLERLITLVMGQSGFQDWIHADQINQHVRLLDQRATDLMKALRATAMDLHCLSVTSGSILKFFFPEGKSAPDTGETLDQARARIESQYSAEMKQLAGIEGAGEAFRDAILAFESAAQLGTRDVMTIYGITAENNQLAGAGVQAFLGFFDQQFRDHDYDVGRSHAQEVLRGLAGSKDGLGPLRFVPGDIRPIDSDLNGMDLGGLSRGDVETFRKGITKRANQIFRTLGWPVADPVVDLIVKLAIRHATEPPPINPMNPLGDLGGG